MWGERGRQAMHCQSRSQTRDCGGQVTVDRPRRARIPYRAVTNRPGRPDRPSGRGTGRNETDIQAAEPQASQQARIPLTHEHEGRPRDTESAAAAGTPGADRAHRIQARKLGPRSVRPERPAGVGPRAAAQDGADPSRSRDPADVQGGTAEADPFAGPVLPSRNPRQPPDWVGRAQAWISDSGQESSQA